MTQHMYSIEGIDLLQNPFFYYLTYISEILHAYVKRKMNKVLFVDFFFDRKRVKKENQVTTAYLGGILKILLIHEHVT